MSNTALEYYEIIDGPELAKRLCLPKTWIYEQTRNRSTDGIPHLRFGRYVRFRWQSPELTEWLKRRMSR
jgi:predicted DNA-binding transcriptional regulator AlpA